MPGDRPLRTRLAAVTVAGLLFAAAVCLARAATSAAAAVEPIDFARDIRPILEARCVDCHGPAKQKGNLRLDDQAAFLKGGSTGPAVVPGKAGESHLIRLVAGEDKDAVMPPKGDRLTPAQLATLRAWVDQGATWPADAAVAATGGGDKADHWSFKPVARPTVPAVADAALAARVRGPIDAFVVGPLAKAKLAFNPDAGKPAILRRLTFDLTGLPPTPAEVDAFTTDASPDAYKKVVDRLLASSAYGERWGRHWLDVVRYADTHGFEMNQPRPNAWRYRDWVIQSFNDDKPYDRFVIEQLAGDALAAKVASESKAIDGAGGGSGVATGFLVAGPWDQVKSPDPVLTAQQRSDELHDMAATTGSAFLGLTVGCARCHDHKFDPVSQRDYFGVVACFSGVRHGDRAIGASADAYRDATVKQLRREIAVLDAALAKDEPIARVSGGTGSGGDGGLAATGDSQALRPPVSARRNVERFEPVEARFVRFEVRRTNDGAEPCVDELEAFTADAEPVNVAALDRGATATASGTYPKSAIHRLEHLNDGRYGNERSWISDTRGRGWVQVKFDRPHVINRVEWSRDRSPTPQYGDRLATDYSVNVSADGSAWREVASSSDRAPPAPKVSDGKSTTVGTARPARSPADSAAHEAKLEARRSAEARLAEMTQPAMAYAGTFAAPEATHRLQRGEVTQPREEVIPAGPASIGKPLTIDPAAPEPQRRLALARWLADPANPLTARVIVNRLWHYHFGRGIVATPSDFGHMGAKPTHPELLNWLVAELVDNGWHLKPIHRQIVLSTAYRQSTAATGAGLAADADATLLWRYPPRRLEAEAIRDAMLAVAGTLDRTPGGPGFSLFEPTSAYVRIYVPREQFGPAEFRRMVYQQKPRTQQDGIFGAFDCPDAAQIAPTRTVSTTPLQALNLLNSGFAMQVAEAWAARLKKEVGGGESDVAGQVSLAFRLAFARPPTEREAAMSAAFVREQGLVLFCRALLNANEFVYLD